jgi:hypothetical protein
MIFISLSASILSDVTVEEAVRRVIKYLPEDPIDSDSDIDIEDIQISKLEVVDTDRKTDGIKASESGKEVNPSTANSVETPSNSALTLLNSERQLMAFSSPAAGYFNNREYQGLIPMIPDDQDTDIQRGQFGIASSYKRYEKEEKS